MNINFDSVKFTSPLPV